MKRRLIRALALILAGLLLSAGLVACGEAPKSPLVDATSETIAEKDTTDYVQLALDELGEIDWEGKEFTILCRDGFADEIYAFKGTLNVFLTSPITKMLCRDPMQSRSPRVPRTNS